MSGFSGFGNRGRLIKIPGRFFSDLLPQIDHLAELKVTLYIFWRLQTQEDRFYVWEREIMSDDVFLDGLKTHATDSAEFVRDGLERSVIRGTLLKVNTASNEMGENIYMVNTARGREAVKGVEDGSWRPDDMPDTFLNLRVERPTVYTLYEQNIGPLTPLIAEQLRDLEETYSEEWVEEAIKKAVSYNVRKMAYILSVLKTRAKDGNIPQKEIDPAERFLSGKYGDEIQS